MTCETNMKTNRKCPEYWGMPHNQTFGVMEFFGMWVLGSFSPDGKDYVSPSLVMETLRMKILT